MSLALMFPGQGSQRRGMGADLFAERPDEVRIADEVLGYSIRELCEDRDKRLSRTEFVQPAMFVVNALHYLHREGTGPAPAFLAGHSLGEYNALHAAGCFDFGTGVDLVRQRGALMAACPPGAMMVVLGITIDELRDVLAANRLAGVDVANHNSPTQIVVSGPKDEIRALAAAIDDHEQAKTAPLKVSCAAHSRYMQSAATEFGAVLGRVDFAEPNLPVLSNVTARPHEVESIAENLTRQLTDRVLWWDTMQALAHAGVDEVEEVGPGEILTHMWTKAAADELLESPPAPEPAKPAPSAPDHGARRPVTTRSPAGHHWVSALGDPEFARAYGVRRPYVAGGLDLGVSGPAFVRKLADAGLFGFLGTRGLPIAQTESDVRELTDDPPANRWGIALPFESIAPRQAREVVSLALRADVRHAETDGRFGVTAQLARWRYAGARMTGGRGAAARRLLVRVSNTETARDFLRPAPRELLDALRRSGELDDEAATAAQQLPVASDICAEPDDDTGAGMELLLPSLRAVRDDSIARHSYVESVPVGAADISTPEEVASAVLLGADFIVAGSINQCTRQARMADRTKDLLASLAIDDTVRAPSAELFEMGGTRRLVRKGTLFPARAAKLYQLYRACSTLDDIDSPTRDLLERDYFGCRLDEVRAALDHDDPAVAGDPRRQLASVFRRYFDLGASAAVRGDADQQLNFHIPCGPAMGAFNRFADDAGIGDWRLRDVDGIAERLMSAGAELLDHRLRDIVEQARGPVAEPAHS